MRVLIADNHPIFRKGLRQCVEDLPGFDVIGEAADGESCVAQAELLRPDIVTIDLNMPGLDGFEAAERIRHLLPSALIVIVTMHAGRAFVEKAREVGADAFLAKEDAGAELALAFERAQTGFFMSSLAGRQERDLVLEAGEAAEAVRLLGRLTPTERRVLRLVAGSLTSRDIASELGVAERTIHTHRNNIAAKLGLRGANSLIAFAVAHKDRL